MGTKLFDVLQVSNCTGNFASSVNQTLVEGHGLEATTGITA